MSAHEIDDLPARGDVIGGRYRIEQRLGAGATGVVYEASHELTGQVVAIKWLRPDLASSDALTARFLREARAACAIDHPNVVAVFDAGRERGTLFLVMERLRGEPLGAFLARGPHRPEVVIATLMPALRGVVAAHEHGIVHRDLKPDNVFLAQPRRGWPGGAKVLDFGISKLRTPEDGRELTHAGAFLGSPLYMAPEQILAPSDVDARADVYSLGIMIYEALAGRVPYEAESLHELFRIVMTELPRPLHVIRDDVPEALDRIVRRAMSRDKDRRHASVRELAAELEPYARGAATFDDSTSRDLARLPAAGATDRPPPPDTDPSLREGRPSDIPPSGRTRVSIALPPADPPTLRSLDGGGVRGIDLPLDDHDGEEPTAIAPSPIHADDALPAIPAIPATAAMLKEVPTDRDVAHAAVSAAFPLPFPITPPIALGIAATALGILLLGVLIGIAL